MDTRHLSESRDYGLEEPSSAPSPFTANYIATTFRVYRGIIGLVLLAVVVGYLIVGIAAYLLAPAVRLTSLNFRLEFTGAEKGQYPNGARFASSDIISTPVLLRTFKQNELDRFTTFRDFVSSVFVVESNEAREALSREYQARLADTRLTTIDRERIQREYELKAGSFSKNLFSINYSRRRRDAVPNAMAEKVLHDILKNWADYASNERHVLEHRVAVLSPDVVAPTTADTRNAIVATVVLRGNVMRLIENIREIRALPNAELMRTPDGLSLNDISIGLEDVVRFQLDPLVDRIAAARLDDRAETLRFLSTQLAYDERTLAWRRNAADATQRTLTLYVSAQPQGTLTGTALEEPTKGGENETLIINDSFIDRLVQLTTKSADTDFRQKLAQDYQVYSMAISPAEAAVGYDKAVLESVRNSTGPVTRTTADEIEKEIATTRGRVRHLAGKVQELHKIVSTNLNPTAELVTSSTPRTRIDRGISLKTIVLVGVLLTLVALVASVLLSLFHSRIREEDHETSGIATQAQGAA